MIRHWTAALVFGAIGLAGLARSAWADGAGASTGPSPATVSNRIEESQLSSIRLTQQAETRLGIRTEPVERRSLSRTRTYPGEVMVPPGLAVLLYAPVAGMVTGPSKEPGGPTPGMQVSAATILYYLKPDVGDGVNVLAAGDRISLAKARADLLTAKGEAEAQVRAAGLRVEASNVRLERARILKQDNAGSQRSCDDALAEQQFAQAALTAANARVAALQRVLSELEAGQHAAVPVAAPLSGVIRAIHVAPGQAVPAAAPLCEVVAMDPLWVRTPVYAGEFDQLDVDSNARVCEISGSAKAGFVPARRVHPAGSADPIAATVDLYFEVANANGRFRPGQRVGVAIQSRLQIEGPVIPYSAVLYDIYGGAWIYLKASPFTYARQRIEIQDVVDEVALLSRGPAIGAEVVTTGAAELFGTEFGAGK